MLKSICRIAAILTWLTMAVTSCEDYDTHHDKGTSFEPYNSVVSRFTHLVYIEYKQGTVRVWGPYADSVQVSQEGARLSVQATSDSLALFVYGNAVGDTLRPLFGQLQVQSDRNFALYLNGLYLHSNFGPALQVETQDDTCYLVLPGGSKNVLSDTLYAADASANELACLSIDGHLYFVGTGALTLRNSARPVMLSATDSLLTHALLSSGNVLCNNSMTARFISHFGDAIHTQNGEVRLLRGTWHHYAGQDSLAEHYDTLYTELTSFRAHRDSLSKLNRTISSTLTKVQAELAALDAVPDSLFNDSLQHRTDSLAFLNDSLLKQVDSNTASLSQDTVRISSLSTYLDSLYLHRTIHVETGTITLGEEATLKIYQSPDSVQ